MIETKILEGKSLEVLPTLQDQSIDAVISDPPYPEISRDYGRLTEPDWFTLMDGVVRECRRILRPKGSAVFILQANSRKVGSMRCWLWEFLAKWSKEWNVVQDVYWWNFTAPPTVHCHEKNGLMKPSVKHCVWLGNPDCYRNQTEVLWSPSDSALAQKKENHSLHYSPGGLSKRNGRITARIEERGGCTPFNLLPISNADSTHSSGAKGHPGGTPVKLCSWWVRYLCPPGGIVLDPFAGASSVGVACVRLRRDYVGIEQVPAYCEISRERLKQTSIPANLAEALA